MPTPLCSSNCDVELAPVNYSDCAPNVVYSEIRRVFVMKKGSAPFNNWKLRAEWDARIASGEMKVFTVIGDKPAATSVNKEISNGRRVILGKDHTINYTIDDVSDLNYEFMRSTECGAKYLTWYETEGGYMFGGNEGQLMDHTQDDVLNRGREESETIAGVATFRSKFTPERAASPIFDGENSGSPTVFDTVQTFASAATKTNNGVTTTLGAVDPDAKFEFNKVTTPVGTPTSMDIQVGGVEQASVDFPTDYLGTAFRYTDVGGTYHAGIFKTGVVNF